MAETLKVRVTAVNSAREAMSGADVGATCTDSRIPLFQSDWLQTGMHVVDVRPEEMEGETYEKADVVIGTSNQAVLNYALGTQEERDRRPFDDNYRRRYTNRNHTTLSEVLAGEKPGRENDAQTTLHHNFSAAIQFAAVGYLVYRYAKDNGLGPRPAAGVVPAGYPQLVSRFHTAMTYCGGPFYRPPAPSPSGRGLG